MADGVRTAVLPEASMNVVVVSDNGEALVIDPGATPDRGRTMRAEVRAAGEVVLGVIITHPHWDHVFGLAAFRNVPSYAHTATIDELARAGTRQVDDLRERGFVLPEGFAVPIPTVPVAAPTTIRVGRREVRLDPVGHAHSVGDLVIHIDGVSIVGDLVEVGAPPQLRDADLAGWTAALDHLAETAGPVIIPGHGAVSDHAELDRHRAMFHAALAYRAGTGPIPDGLDLSQLPH